MKSGYPIPVKRHDARARRFHRTDNVLLNFATECSVGLTLLDWFAQTSEVAMMDADSPFEDISAPDDGYRGSARKPIAS